MYFITDTKTSSVDKYKPSLICITPSPYHIHHLQSREKATGLRVDIKLVAGFRKVWFALYMMLITLKDKLP